MSDSDEETGKGGRAPLPRMAASTASGSVQQQTTLHQQSGSDGKEESKASGEFSWAAMRDMLAAMQQQQLDAQVQQQATQAQVQQLLQHLGDRQRDSASVARPIPTPSYRVPPPVGEYSASASIPLPPPGELHTRKQEPRRQSMGQPAPVSSPALFTPAASQAKKAAFVTKLDGDDSEHTASTVVLQVEEDSAADDPVGLPVISKRMREIKKSITSIIKPYHGTMTKDVYTVIDWVEKLDTEFSIQMGQVQEGRLDIVRSVLAGTALKWMNRIMIDLNQQVATGQIAGPVEWSRLRQPFIDAHLGVNTAETFKAELRSLRLGSTLCPTPVELNKQFDHLAEMAYPDRRAEGMASVMGDEYKKIIAASKPWLYKSVALNMTPTTIDEWKRCVAVRWAAEKDVDATMAQLPRSQDDSGWKGGRRGGGGRGDGKAQSVSAMETEDTRQEGEAPSGNQQLAAAASGPGSKGGHGGGGGGGQARGGYGTRPVWDETKQKLFAEGKCFYCKEAGHQRAACPKQAAAWQQSNRKAVQ